MRHRAGEDKSGKKRLKDSFIFYYLCSGQTKDWKGTGHHNCVPARKAEDWVTKCINHISSSDNIEMAIEIAHERSTEGLQPQIEALRLTEEALRQNEEQTNELVSAVTSGNVEAALWTILNQRASALKVERERLLIEKRHLEET